MSQRITRGMLERARNRFNIISLNCNDPEVTEAVEKVLFLEKSESERNKRRISNYAPARRVTRRQTIDTAAIPSTSRSHTENTFLSAASNTLTQNAVHAQCEQEKNRLISMINVKNVEITTLKHNLSSKSKQIFDLEKTNKNLQDCIGNYNQRHIAFKDLREENILLRAHIDKVQSENLRLKSKK